MKIRDTRNGSWFWVNNAVLACPHINATDKVVYSALCTFAGFEEIRPSFKTLAKRASVGERVAKRSIKKLIEVGFVEKTQGGGRGRANVYNLLKAHKGCQICTVSKGCQKEPERVTNTTIKGDKSAPHIDIVIDKDIDSAETSSAFSLKAELRKLEENPRRELNIIALYLEHRKPNINSKEQFQEVLKRHIKPANRLKVFTNEQILKSLEYAKEKYSDFYTIETLLKINTK